MGRKIDPEKNLWKFTRDGRGRGTWATEESQNTALFNQIPMRMLGAFANNNDTAFVIGGCATGWTDHSQSYSQAMVGMVTYNMRTKIWTDEGTGAEPPGHSLWCFCPSYGVEWVDFCPGRRRFLEVGPGAGLQRRTTSFDFRNLTFFSPKPRQTYWQIATRSIPSGTRGEFCVAGFPSPDGGYEM